jgi:hypothetical protein
MNSGDHQAQRKTPRAWLDPRSQVPGGTPSAGLSLGRLRPRRACLRFTRRPQSNQDAPRESSASVHEPNQSRVPLNLGGPLLCADVGPFCAPITTEVTRKVRKKYCVPQNPEPPEPLRTLFPCPFSCLTGSRGSLPLAKVLPPVETNQFLGDAGKNEIYGNWELRILAVIDEDYTQNDCSESSGKCRPLLGISPLRLPHVVGSARH